MKESNFESSNPLSDSKESLKAMEGSLAQEFLTVSRKRKYCKVCKMAFNTDDELRNVHLRTDGHRRNYLGYTYHLNRYVISKTISQELLLQVYVSQSWGTRSMKKLTAND